MSHVRLSYLVKSHGIPVRRGRKLRPVRPSRANELWYKAELLKIVRHMRQLTRDIVFPEVKAHVKPMTDGSKTAHDALPRRSFESAFSQLAQRMGGIANTAQRLATLAVQRNMDAVDERLSSSVRSTVGIDISPFLTPSNPILAAIGAATRDNVDLIKDIPAKYLSQIRETVKANLVEGVRWEDIAAKLEERGMVAESRAKLIARDQTSKMNSAFNQARQTSLGIDKYQWQTSGDERVREDHAQNDGKVFSWNDPPATGHPGHDVNCRCVAIPYFDLDKEEELLGL